MFPERRRRPRCGRRDAPADRCRENLVRRAGAPPTARTAAVPRASLARTSSAPERCAEARDPTATNPRPCAGPRPHRAGLVPNQCRARNPGPPSPFCRALPVSRETGPAPLARERSGSGMPPADAAAPRRRPVTGAPRHPPMHRTCTPPVHNRPLSTDRTEGWIATAISVAAERPERVGVRPAKARLFRVSTELSRHKQHAGDGSQVRDEGYRHGDQDVHRESARCGQARRRQGVHDDTPPRPQRRGTEQHPHGPQAAPFIRCTRSHRSNPSTTKRTPRTHGSLPCRRRTTQHPPPARERSEPAGTIRPGASTRYHRHGRAPALPPAPAAHARRAGRSGSARSPRSRAHDQSARHRHRREPPAAGPPTPHVGRTWAHAHPRARRAIAALDAPSWVGRTPPSRSWTASASPVVSGRRA